MPPGTAPLVTFAVKEEFAPFMRATSGHGNIRAVVTGIGQRNAEQAIRRELDAALPQFVITSGFAGGLDPALPLGKVIFSADENFPAGAALLRAGAAQVQFHCSPQIAATIAVKQKLREATQAGAVEMESGIIRKICRERGVPSATVRVISDEAGEDLPLDFNALYTVDYRLHVGRLLWALAKSPGKIPQLMAFRRRITYAADELTRVLVAALK